LRRRNEKLSYVPGALEESPSAFWERDPECEQGNISLVFAAQLLDANVMPMQLREGLGEDIQLELMLPPPGWAISKCRTVSRTRGEGDDGYG